MPTFFKIIQATLNIFTVFGGDSATSLHHKKNHLLPPESSTSTFLSVLTTSKPYLPVIIQPKNSFSTTIYPQSSSPAMQYLVAPHTFVQCESPPNPLFSTSTMQNKHASVKSSKFSSQSFSQPSLLQFPLPKTSHNTRILFNI